MVGLCQYPPVMEMITKEIPELSSLLREVEKRYGRKVLTSNDFELLSVNIEHTTGERLSSSTLKRLWGYVSLRTAPHLSTLDILARYVGSKDFSDFRAARLGVGDTSGYLDTSFIRSSDLAKGDKLRIGWEPNRVVRLSYEGDDFFTVLESFNSKLRAGDRFEAACFFRGLPLMLSGILRDGAMTLAYIAGKQDGLNLLEKE